MIKKFLLLIIALFSFFVINNNVYALEFTATDGNIYQVVDEETLRDYIYYSKVKNNNSYSSFVLGVANDGYYIFLLYNYDYTLYYNSSNYLRFMYDNNLNSNAYFATVNLNLSKYSSAGSISGLNKAFTILFSPLNIYDENFNNIVFNSNFTLNDIERKYSQKTYYTINYYLNSELYQSVEIEEHTNYSLIEYLPPEHYSFSGWSYDENIDITDVTSSFNIYGTTSYVRPNMNYSENINSPIHDLSIKILGRNIPVEFDFVYTIMDYLILVALIFCILMPFIIVIKLLGGSF